MQMHPLNFGILVQCIFIMFVLISSALVLLSLPPVHLLELPKHGSKSDGGVLRLDAARQLDRYGSSGYGYGGRIDDLYDSEVAPRLGKGEHYMDYTGSSVYLNSQAQSAATELTDNVFGNPHSISPSSQRTTHRVEAVRAELLRFFSADPAQYELVFVRSATGALRALGESFPWSDRSRFAYLVSNHNSVLGIREYARANGAKIGALEEDDVEEWLSHGQNTSLPWDGAAEAAAAGSEAEGPTFSLFGYPALDNFAGVMYPLRWVGQVQAKSTRHHRWKVLLDAAAFVPSHRLNLTQTPADFVCVSFYKLFGLPTGLGAWIIQKDDVEFLRRVYWGGGSVFTATSMLPWRLRRPMHNPARFEDGTLPFLDIIALRHGLNVYSMLGGIDAVERHVTAVGAYLSDTLAGLQHGNGRPLLRLFGKHHLRERSYVQGSTANFEVLKPDGGVFSYKTAMAELASTGFHLRDGCMCNPGACYAATGVRDTEVKKLALSKHGNFTDWEWIWVERKRDSGRRFGHRRHTIKLPLGSLRISLGYMSRMQDVDALADFLARTFADRWNDTSSEAGPIPGQGWC